MILAFAGAWYTKRNDTSFDIDQKIKVSIFIAARNEERNISDCLNSILTQTYKNIEILVIDDHSTDSTVTIVQKFSGLYKNVQYRALPEGIEGKKQALNYGASELDGEYVFLTDADCILQSNHIENMLAYTVKKKVTMLCGPVVYKKTGNLLMALFKLEFLSLTGSGAAGFFLKIPFMCNGANYLINTQVFKDFSIKMNNNYSSGDDVFLLHAVAKKYKTAFIKNPENIVVTESPKSINGFINQRLRWASKSKAYKNIRTPAIALITLLASFALLFLPATVFLNIFDLKLILLIIAIKIFADTIFLIPVLRFHSSEKLLLLVPILTIIHPFYIAFVGLLSFFWKPLWKGRKIKS